MLLSPSNNQDTVLEIFTIFGFGISLLYTEVQNLVNSFATIKVTSSNPLDSVSIARSYNQIIRSSNQTEKRPIRYKGSSISYR
ncbi:MAG: hypothetical protein WB612_06080 [Nitrososphaeraceae archaeon]